MTDILTCGDSAPENLTDVSEPCSAEKKRTVLKLSFRGTDFHGWQIQPETLTIQGELCRALKELYGEPISVYGCSRTDSGVHANEYFCHFDTSRPFELSRLPYALNAHLPRSIAVSAAYPVPGTMHCRFSVDSKEYKYLFWTGPFRNPIYGDLSYHSIYRLDCDLMDRAAGMLVGTHDFRAFMAQGSSASNTVRTVKYASVKKEDGFAVFTVAADGFLYNMVRIMAGTLMYVSVGKIAPDGIPDVIASLERSRAGVTLPPQGLYLNKVTYKNEFKEFLK